MFHWTIITWVVFWTSSIFIPKIGEMIQFVAHIFQMGGEKPPTRLHLKMYFPTGIFQPRRLFTLLPGPLFHPFSTCMIWYIYLHLVDFYGFHVGKYTRQPWMLWEMEPNDYPKRKTPDAKLNCRIKSPINTTALPLSSIRMSWRVFWFSEGSHCGKYLTNFCENVAWGGLFCLVSFVCFLLVPIDLKSSRWRN